MSVFLQYIGLLLCVLCSLASSQSQERVWHTTAPASATPPPPEKTSTTRPEEPLEQDAATEPELSATDVPQVVHQEGLADTESSDEPPEQVDSLAEDVEPLVLAEESVVESKNAPGSSEISTGKKPRKWMSVQDDVSSESNTKSEEVEEKEKEDEENEEVDEENKEIPPVTEESDAVPTHKQKAIELPALDLPKNISEMLEAAEEGIPMVQETIISRKTTVYVTITEALGDNEPLYVNLTGLRDLTGQERQIVGGCLDLSNLELTGEEAKEVISRMAKHKFHKLDLSNNLIREFPTNTFGPVAFTVRELRLDGNPLLSNCHEEGSMLQRGGLFHLTELRELNLSWCGLKDIDFFTPWNSNHLEVIDLSGNGLSRVPSNLQFFHKLKKLHLNHNPVTEIEELPFALLWNIQVLTMSGCRISAITSDPFRNMERLKQLSIEGNNLTRIGDVRLPRSSSSVKMYLSGNPWHCACDMLTFVEHYNYAIRDLEDIRCSSPRWLEGLRAAYLTKEILSLDSVDGNCSPPRVHPEVVPAARQHPPVRAERLEVFAVAVFALAAILMLVHILWAKRREKVRSDDHHEDINYIKIEKKCSFK